jgi:hypothetical protein
MKHHYLAEDNVALERKIPINIMIYLRDELGLKRINS